MRTTQIATVLDVGANYGQFGSEIRANGYEGRILSFEPASAAFSKLERVCADDAAWYPYPYAIGSKSETGLLNVSGNIASSSFNQMLERHRAIAPASAYTHTESVQIHSLDALVADLPTEGRLGLKMDVQGFEAAVLSGAQSLLDDIWYLECEVLLEPLYEGQASARTLLDGILSAGFDLAGSAAGWVDEVTGRAAWLETMFVRSG